MTQKEGELIAQAMIKESISKGKSSSPFMDESMQILLGSLNAQDINGHAFKDPYVFYRDTKVPNKNGSELLW